jgi:hypothetical protein
LTKPVSLKWLERKIVEWGCMQVCRARRLYQTRNRASPLTVDRRSSTLMGGDGGSRLIRKTGMMRERPSAGSKLDPKPQLDTWRPDSRSTANPADHLRALPDPTLLPRELVRISNRHPPSRRDLPDLRSPSRLRLLRLTSYSAKCFPRAREAQLSEPGIASVRSRPTRSISIKPPRRNRSN